MSSQPAPLMGSQDVPVNSILTLSITCPIPVFQTGSEVLESVAADLQADGRMTVVGSPQVLTSSLNTLYGTIASVGNDQPIQFSMQVQVNTEFGNLNDPLSIVENFFQQESGNYPTAASTTGIQTPGQTAATPTGVPGANPAGLGGSNSSSTGIASGVSGFFSSLTGTASTILIALVAVIILALILIAYGPNVGRIASAVA